MFWRAVLRKEFRATDRGWYVQSVSKYKKYETVGMGDLNLSCTEYPRPSWTWAFSNKLISQKLFIPVSLVATGWWKWRGQARTAALSPCSTGRRSTSPWRCSIPTGETLLDFSWRRAKGGGLPWGATWPQTTPRQ